MQRRSQRGFTLIEIMIVILIIGLLLMILLPNLARSRYQAQWSACVQYQRTLAAALESYHAQEGFYPVDFAPLLTGEKYINQIPTCPSNGSSYNLGYTVAANHDNFTIACAGAHYQVLPEVTQGYPQYNPGLGTRQWDSTR